MADTLATLFLADAVREFRGLQALADKAAAQVDDAAFFSKLDLQSNSIAIVYKHLAGNMRSRWTDFLTTDGEKTNRNRDSEFEIGPEDTRAALEQRMQVGWQILFGTLGALGPDDLLAKVTIRGEAHGVLEAIHRQIAHYGYHVGQVVLLAKHACAGNWQTLSIPRGGSQAFDARLREWYGTGATGSAPPGSRPRA